MFFLLVTDHYCLLLFPIVDRDSEICSLCLIAVKSDLCLVSIWGFWCFDLNGK